VQQHCLGLPEPTCLFIRHIGRLLSLAVYLFSGEAAVVKYVYSGVVIGFGAFFIRFGAGLFVCCRQRTGAAWSRDGRGEGHVIAGGKSMRGHIVRFD